MTLAAPFGGDGNDILIGGSGSDLFFGTLAEDVMIFEYGRITLENGKATSVVVLGQSPLDLAATAMFGLYLKPWAPVPEYTVAPRTAVGRPMPEPSIVVSTGDREMIASHHQQVAQTISLPGVEFELGSPTLTPLGADIVAQVGMVLADFPGAVIEVAGHTDATGSMEFNQTLSQLRAEAVREALIAQGIDPARLRAVGHGEERPIADNETEEGRARNRRVELTLSEAPENAAPDSASSPLEPGVIGVLSLQGWRSTHGLRAAHGALRRRIDW
jgi:outer membrane protein OmpA-like peptidoglycan-associated protein